MNNKKWMNESQKLMVFVLSMSMYGLATLLTELIPSIPLGPIELSVEYFLFIPLTLAMLFDPLSAALGAATGELVFSEIMLGQFGGLGEVEKFLTVTIGVYLAGRLLKNPESRKMVAICAFIGTAMQLFMGTMVDVLKVVFSVEEFEAVEGLPESVFVTEGIAFLVDLVFSGTLFCILPSMFLVPALHGKIEPLLGVSPRTNETIIGNNKVINLKVILFVLFGFICAVGFEFLAESGFELVDWEAAWAESKLAMIISMVISVIVIAIIIGAIVYRKKNDKVEEIYD